MGVLRQDRFGGGEIPSTQGSCPSGQCLGWTEADALPDRGNLPAAVRAPGPRRRFDSCGLVPVLADCRVALRLGSPVQAQGPWPTGRHPIRPVLKHGPRSLTCARVIGWQTHRRSESGGRLDRHQVGSRPLGDGRTTGPSRSLVDEAEQERTCWDPKDGELCLSRTKPEETLVEVRSDSDVQIDRQTWV